MRPERGVLPGFGLSLGITLTFLSVLVIGPLALLAIKAFSLSPLAIWEIVTKPRTLSAFRLSIGASLIAAGINALFGTLAAWVLVRYQFPGRRLVDALVDLPFALPTAVAGITLAAVYSENSPLGGWLAELGIKAAFTPMGVVIALTFIGLPFVVRTVQPVLEELEPQWEEAAATLGASRLQVLRRVILPELLPSMATGFALAFARALGEYGSVIFIAGNMPGKSEIVPLLVMIKLEQFDYPGAAAISVVFLAICLLLMLGVNALAWRSGRRLLAH
ncbi:MAG: sulfate ABC transporter permease subunit CysT [Acidobacteriota bacterium]